MKAAGVKDTESVKTEDALVRWPECEAVLFLTGNQNLIIADTKKDEVNAILGNYGFGPVKLSGLRQNFNSCVA
jgi:sulfite reductase beta subunit-like hemoprotein